MYCDFDLAKNLNEHGFIEYCEMVYLKYDDNQISLKNRLSPEVLRFLTTPPSFSNQMMIDAPSLEQVNEWFMLKHKVEISAFPSEIVGKWRCNIYDLNTHHVICNVNGGKLFDSKFEANEAGINRMLESI